MTNKIADFAKLVLCFLRREFWRVKQKTPSQPLVHDGVFSSYSVFVISPIRTSRFARLFFYRENIDYLLSFAAASAAAFAARSAAFFCACSCLALVLPSSLISPALVRQILVRKGPTIS